MTSRKPLVAALVGLVMLPSLADAQFPTLPGGAAAGGAGAPATAVAAAAGAAPTAPRTLWGFLGLNPTSMQNAHTKLQLCRDKFCQSQFGQMLGGFTGGPLAGVTGGFIPSLCPPAPSPATLSALESQSGPMGAEAVAGKIKQSEADAKARVAAIEYLGTVDCNRWKEARIALINGLRADPNECVRYAAARVLNTGCCCSKPVIEALRVCVSGEDTDGNPPETSQRVKAAAFSALQNCLVRVPEDLPPEQPPPIRERDRGGPVLGPEGSAGAEGSIRPVMEPRREGLPGLDRLPGSEGVPGLNRLPGSEGVPGPPINQVRPMLGPAIEGSRTEPRRNDKVEQVVAVRAAAGRRQAPDQPRPPKTFAQTVNDARRTLFQVSQNPTPPTTLPPGKRTLLHAFLKAKQDLAHQQAAEAAEAGVGAAPEADHRAGPDLEPQSLQHEAGQNADGPAK